MARCALHRTPGEFSKRPENMSKAISPYYPPRARWYAPVFRVVAATRLGIAMDRIRFPSALRWRGLALSFFVPGLGFYLRGPRLYGRIALVACGLLFLIFAALLGHPLGNFAFALMISTHTSGIAYYCGPALKDWTLRNRVLLTILILTSVSCLYYGPLRDLIQSQYVIPLRINDRVVVVQQLTPMGSVRRGDWIAYQINDSSGAGDDTRIHIHSGIGFGPILAVAGDAVQFSANDFSVNGVRHPALPNMPSNGSFVVAQHQWFIWPNYNVNGHGYVNQVPSIMLKLANVSEDQYAGKPFKHWFWRKQILK